MPSGSPKVCVIGLDGATFDVLDRWVASGDMPNLAALMERSARADLISTVPPITGPAWTSMTTGVNPGKHGIFDFAKLLEGGRDARFVRSGDVATPRLWDLFQDAGYRVGAFRVPVTYPAKPVDGFMVTGLLTPSRGRYIAHPPELGDSIRDASKKWFHSLGDRESAIGDPEDILEADAASAEVLHGLLKEFQPSFFMGVNSEVDHLQHRLWPYCAGKDGTEGTPEREVVRRLMRSVDAGIGWLVEFFGSDAYVFVVSDHGFGELEGSFGLNDWLAERGYIKLRRGRVLAGLAYRKVVRIGKNLLQRIGLLELARGILRAMRLVPDAKAGRGRRGRRRMAGLVDWGQTSAMFTSSSAGGLFLNTDGRSPQPRITSQEQREEVLAQLRADMLAIEDPDTGEPLVTMLKEREEVFEGPYTGDAPDLLFSLRNDAVAAVTYAGSTDIASPPRNFTGMHRPNGIFLAAGPGVQAGNLPDLNILDVAPTVLHAAGLPVPSYMDGVVRREFFRADAAGAREVEYVDAEIDYGRADRDPMPADDEDRAEVEKRLRNLGYL